MGSSPTRTIVMRVACHAFAQGARVKWGCKAVTSYEEEDTCMSYEAEDTCMALHPVWPAMENDEHTQRQSDNGKMELPTFFLLFGLQHIRGVGWRCSSASAQIAR